EGSRAGRPRHGGGLRAPRLPARAVGGHPRRSGADSRFTAEGAPVLRLRAVVRAGDGRSLGAARARRRRRRMRGAVVVSRRTRGRGAYRKPVLVRVGELLTTNPTIWFIGLTVGVCVLVLTSLLGAALGLLMLIPLVVVATAALDLKGRLMILRWRILLTRQSITRRQFLAMNLSVLVVAAVTTAFGWTLRGYILGSYDEQVRRHMTRRPRRCRRRPPGPGARSAAGGRGGGGGRRGGWRGARGGEAGGGGGGGASDPAAGAGGGRPPPRRRSGGRRSRGPPRPRS